jgi:hypothetical protein
MFHTIRLKKVGVKLLLQVSREGYAAITQTDNVVISANSARCRRWPCPLRSETGQFNHKIVDVGVVQNPVQPAREYLRLPVEFGQ